MERTRIRVYKVAIIIITPQLVCLFDEGDFGNGRHHPEERRGKSDIRLNIANIIKKEYQCIISLFGETLRIS